MTLEHVATTVAVDLAIGVVGAIVRRRFVTASMAAIAVIAWVVRRADRVHQSTPKYMKVRTLDDVLPPRSALPPLPVSVHHPDVAKAEAPARATPLFSLDNLADGSIYWRADGSVYGRPLFTPLDASCGVIGVSADRCARPKPAEAEKPTPAENVYL